MSMTYYAVTDDPNELVHWGIKGMKWGVRRTDAQLGHPRHTGSNRKPRSAAYKKAQSKLGKMMKSGIKKAEAHWKAYNSPKAKYERQTNRALEKARKGKLKYGKLDDAQVRRITERLNMERQARQLSDTEQTFRHRLAKSIGEGVVKGIGTGTAAYFEERFRGRGRTTAEIKADKRKAKYESDQRVQQRKARNKVNQEYYEEAARRGYNPGWLGAIAETDESRAKQLRGWKERDAKEEERDKRQSLYLDEYTKTFAKNKAQTRAARAASLHASKHGYSLSTTSKEDDKGNTTTTINVGSSNSINKPSPNNTTKTISKKKTPPQRYRSKKGKKKGHR